MKKSFSERQRRVRTEVFLFYGVGLLIVGAGIVVVLVLLLVVRVHLLLRSCRRKVKSSRYGWRRRRVVAALEPCNGGRTRVVLRRSRVVGQFVPLRALERRLPCAAAVRGASILELRRQERSGLGGALRKRLLSALEGQLYR